MEMDEELADPNEWNSLWNCSFESYYDAFFQELCSEFAMQRWRLFDVVNKFLVGATASTSAIAGWTLWEDPIYRDIWAWVAGGAALLAILNGSINVSERIKEETLIFSGFKNLRLELDHFRKKMSFMAHESMLLYKKEYLEILDRYGKISVKSRPDVFLTQKRKEKIQSKLNRTLGYE